MSIRNGSIIAAALHFAGERRNAAMPVTATTKISIRVSEERRALIDRGARAAGKDRTEFMLEAAEREATAILLDLRYFQLDSKAFEKFNAALDASPAENPRLRKLLARKPRWQR
jgi:uncharacterized protein (DUF1778 family)